MIITGEDVIAEARRWLETRYVHQGRTRFGVDCIGYVICVRNAIDPIPDIMREVTNYARNPQAVLIERIQKYCTRIHTPEVGCIILIRWFKDEHPSHAAIYAGETMMHSYKNAGKVVEVGYRAQWVRWTHSFWRMPGVTAA